LRVLDGAPREIIQLDEVLFRLAPSFMSILYHKKGRPIGGKYAPTDLKCLCSRNQNLWKIQDHVIQTNVVQNLLESTREAAVFEILSVEYGEVAHLIATILVSFIANTACGAFTSCRWYYQCTEWIKKSFEC
jgi:hypothetical protein